MARPERFELEPVWRRERGTPLRLNGCRSATAWHQENSVVNRRNIGCYYERS